ncbi:hypothetical protein Emag_006692 [Eimeria magna]
MTGSSLVSHPQRPGIVVSPSSDAPSSRARVLRGSRPQASRGPPYAARSATAAAEAAGEDIEEEGRVEALRAAALEASASLAKAIRAQVAPTESHLQEAYLFEITSGGPLEEASMGAKAHGSRGAGSSRSDSAAAAAASTAAGSLEIIAAATRQEQQHEGGPCSGGDGGDPRGGGGSGGCLKPGDIEAAAAAGFCSWCCCAFPRLSCPQVSQTTIRRLFKMQRHNFEVAGVRWLCSALQPSVDRKAVGAAILADDPGMLLLLLLQLLLLLLQLLLLLLPLSLAASLGRTCQALMLLSLAYQLGAFTSPSLIVVSGGPCDETTSSSSSSSNSSSSSSSKVADLLQMRRWIQLAKDWAPSLAVRPLLCAEDVQGAFLSAHPEGWGGAAAATAAAAVGPSVSSLHAAPAASEQETVSKKGGDETPKAHGPLYVSTFAALLEGQESKPLLDFSKKHTSLALVVFDTRCRRQCDWQQQHQQQQQQQQQEQQQQHIEGAACGSASRCCSALHSENSLSYAAMEAADLLWGAPLPGAPETGTKGERAAASARGRVKKLIITDGNHSQGAQHLVSVCRGSRVYGLKGLACVVSYSKIDSYEALRLLLPRLLPSTFLDPPSVDRLALRGASSQGAAAAAAAATAAAATAAAAYRFARGCAFPLVLRRSRVSVLIKELPVPRRALHLLNLTSAQAEAYAAIEAACSQGLLAAAGAAAAPKGGPLGGKGGAPHRAFHRRPQDDVEAITAKAVTDMRMVCIHPALVAACSSSSNSSSKSSSSSGERGDAAGDPLSKAAHPLVSPELLEVRPFLVFALCESDLAFKGPYTFLLWGCVLHAAANRRAGCSSSYFKSPAASRQQQQQQQQRETGIVAAARAEMARVGSDARGVPAGAAAALVRAAATAAAQQQADVRLLLDFKPPAPRFAAPGVDEACLLPAVAFWLAEFLDELRKEHVGGDGETKADEASSREETAGKVLLLNPLPMSCGSDGSACLLLRDLLLPKPLCIDAKDNPLSATQKIRDFRRAEIQQIQVLLVEDIELLLQLPPHVFSGIRNVVWLSPIVGKRDRRPQGVSPPASPLGLAEATAAPQEAEGGAAVMLAVEQRLVSVGTCEAFPYRGVFLRRKA